MREGREHYTERIVRFSLGVAQSLGPEIARQVAVWAPSAENHLEEKRIDLKPLTSATHCPGFSRGRCAPRPLHPPRPRAPRRCWLRRVPVYVRGALERWDGVRAV